MRGAALAVAALLAAGCPSPGACPVDTVSSASQCIPIDMAVPADLTRGCAGIAPFCDVYNGPSLCINGAWWCEGPARFDLGAHD